MKVNAVAVIGQVLGAQLAPLLGLPRCTRSFTLRCVVDEIVTVECEYFPEGVSGPELETVFAQYGLVERKQPKSIDFDSWMSARKEAAHAAFLSRNLVLERLDRQLAWDRQAAGMTESEIANAFMMGRISSSPA